MARNPEPSATRGRAAIFRARRSGFASACQPVRGNLGSLLPDVNPRRRLRRVGDGRLSAAGRGPAAKARGRVRMSSREGGVSPLSNAVLLDSKEWGGSPLRGPTPGGDAPVNARRLLVEQWPKARGCPPRSPNPQRPPRKRSLCSDQSSSGASREGRRPRRSGARVRRPQPGVGAGEGRGNRSAHGGLRLGNDHPGSVTGAFTGVVPGVSSHLGEVTVQIEGTGAPTSDGSFAGSGTTTIVAANGDELTGTMTLTRRMLPTGRTTTTVAVTITGGTGRFADASGTLTVICQSGGPALVDGLLLIKAECKFTGQPATRRFEPAVGGSPWESLGHPARRARPRAPVGAADERAAK